MNKIRVATLMLCAAGKEPEYLSKQLTEEEYKTLVRTYESLKHKFDLSHIRSLLCAEDINVLMQSLPQDTIPEEKVEPLAMWLSNAAENITPHAHKAFRTLAESDLIQR